MDCLIRYCDSYEIPVSVVHINWGVYLVQGSESPFNPTVIIPYCLEIIPSSSSTFVMKSAHEEGWVYVYFCLAPTLVWHYNNPAHVIYYLVVDPYPRC